MIYREFGTTGKKVSAIGFGGMRFPDPANEDASVEIVLAAFDAGVTYFDTAPVYCGDKSEEIVGKAVLEMKRRGGEFYVSTKSSKSDGAQLRRDLEKSLKRLNVDAVDFYHCWCVITRDAWEARKAGGAVKELLKARDEGLVRHVCISTHLDGGDIAEVLAEGYFDGVTLGYNATNAPYRLAGIRGAEKLGLGVVVMNPLGGGMIPKHPDRFSYIGREGDFSLAESALRFVLSTPGVTVALVGMDSVEHAREAARAADGFTPLGADEMAAVGERAEQAFNQLCTLCRYCDVCPEGIEVYKHMAAYNYKILETDEMMQGNLRWHWGVEDAARKLADTCVRCGTCEEKCTQKLPIMDRLADISAVLNRLSGKAK